MTLTWTVDLSPVIPSSLTRTLEMSGMEHSSFKRDCIGDLGFYGQGETGSEFDYGFALGATYQLCECFVATEYDYNRTKKTL